jgi:hypothetical protein
MTNITIASYRAGHFEDIIIYGTKMDKGLAPNFSDKNQLELKYNKIDLHELTSVLNTCNTSYICVKDGKFYPTDSINTFRRDN